MHLVVCVKQEPDPEIPPRDFAIDPATRRPVPGRAPLVISTFDEIAVERALKLGEPDTVEAKVDALVQELLRMKVL